MSTKVVHLIASTKSLLTREFISSTNKPAAEIVDLDGNTLSRDEMHRAREVYMATHGEHYVKISHTEKELLMEDNFRPATLTRLTESDLCQGVGDVHGWFILAPDLTLFGRFGERDTRGQIPNDDYHLLVPPSRLPTRRLPQKPLRAKKKAAKKTVAKEE